MQENEYSAPPAGHVLGIPCMTSLDTANALMDILGSRFSLQNTELVDINHMRR